jgi:hypothetical protein
MLLGKRKRRNIRKGRHMKPGAGNGWTREKRTGREPILLPKPFSREA